MPDSTPKQPSAAGPDPGANRDTCTDALQRRRATSVSSHRAPIEGLSRKGRPSGLRLANDILHPSYMLEPGQEGYRTPAGEDLERNTRFRSKVERLRRNMGIASPLASRCEDAASYFPVALNKEALPHPPRSSSSTVSTAVDAPPSKRGGSCRLKTRLEDVLVLNWRQRLKHFTWSFFTITMATGGIANVLYHVPFRFSGLYTLGVIFFALNVFLFIINVFCISLRFFFHKNTFKNSLLHPTESLFAPAAVVSFGTILLNISQYGTEHVGPWLNTVVVVLFWVDVWLAIVSSFGVYLLMWSTQSFTIALMTPVWIFPAYPLLIIGPHAGVLSTDLAATRAQKILIGGFVAQGIGMLVSFMVYAAYIYRLMTQKLPRQSLRPGMFVSVGPAAFTASGLINMAKNAMRAYGGTDFMGNGDLAAMIMKVIADWTALWLWGLSFWFFFVSVGAHHTILLRRARVPFAMTWFSYVFPQTALINATFAVANAFDIEPLQIIGCVMVCLLIAMWLFVVTMMLRAIWLKQLLWPQQGEDKDEGGFKGSPLRQSAADESAGARETTDPANQV